MTGRMAGFAGLKRVVALAIGLVTCGAAAAQPAVAGGPGLPRTYQVTTIDSPKPAVGGGFPLQMSPAGDLDRDGTEDLLLPQLANSPNDDGELYVINSKTGQLIATIPSPDPGNGNTATGNNRANFGFPWISKLGTNVAPAAGAVFTDLASCQNRPSTPGALCLDARIGPADGVPEILVGARGVDARGLKDAGRVYVFDGASFALLKRIDQPVADTTTVALSRAGGTWFGRTVLNPAGVPACSGNSGVGDCEIPTFPVPGAPAGTTQRARAVEKGDLDGRGLPDLVIGASSTTENAASAHPSSHCARTSPANATCAAAGRVYFYYGEDIVGSSPQEILDGTVDGNLPGGSVRDESGNPREDFKRLRNIDAQADNPAASSSADSEIFGNSLTPIGDIGTCRATQTAPIPPAGERCPRSQLQSDADGKPDIVVSHQRADLPLDNPRTELGDAGAAYVVDGATGTFLSTYENPEPERGAVFGAQTNQFAAGDLGDVTKPDVFLGSPSHNTPTVTAAGRGYVMNGNITTGASAFNFSRLDDPTPVKAGNFGATHVGVGDLVVGPATPANELLIGSGGGFYGAAPQTEIISDVHVFNPFKEKSLQTIPDPAQQGASQFGSDLVPLGDINADTFLDFAGASPGFDGPVGVNQGRVYIFRSDNSPPPALTSSPPNAPGSAPVPPPVPAVGPVTGPYAIPSRPQTIKAGDCANQFRGTDRDDRLRGTRAGDTIFGFAGDDSVDGRDANDCLDGGQDDDQMDGSSGADRLVARDGDDLVRGGSGKDRLFGEDGRDRMLGGSGNDMLAGGAGNDVLAGGSGGNRLFGEGGNDRLVAVNRRRDLVDCGPGRDAARIDRGDRVRRCEKVRRRGRVK